jgi:hypothetical protein
MLTYEKALIPQNKIKNLPIQAPILKLPLLILHPLKQLVFNIDVILFSTFTF